MHDHGIEAQHKCNAVLPRAGEGIRARSGRGKRRAFPGTQPPRGPRRDDLHRHRQDGARRAADALHAGAVFQIRGRNARALSRIIPRRSRTQLRSRSAAISSSNSASRSIPEYPAPEGKTREAYLRELCYKGLHERYGERAGTDSELIKRLDYEVDILERTGFVSYFLIVWDFIHFAKQHGIPVGPGRGSAAGSMVAYVLGITDIDPLQLRFAFRALPESGTRFAAGYRRRFLRSIAAAKCSNTCGKNTAIAASRRSSRSAR